MLPLVWPSAVISRVSHHNMLSTITRSIICRIQLMCPKRVHSVGFFKALLDNDYRTDAASMVRVTLMPRPPNSSIYFN
eukprot:8571007-Pyramimonas_sp.AAC.1